MVGGEQNQSVLTCERGDQEIELGQHPALGAQLAEKFGECRGVIFVGGPEPEYSECRLQTSQIPLKPPAESNASAVFTKHGKADSETVSGTERLVDPPLDIGLAVEVG